MCDLWWKTVGQSLKSCRSKTQEEQLKCQRLLRAICLISVCSSAAAQQQKTQLQGMDVFRNTVIMRQMFIWNMSADPASEVSSLLLPNPVPIIGRHLIALQRSLPLFSTPRFPYIRNLLNSSSGFCIQSCFLYMHLLLMQFYFFPSNMNLAVVLSHRQVLVSLSIIEDCSCVSKTRLVFLVSLPPPYADTNQYLQIVQGREENRPLQRKQTSEGWYWTLGDGLCLCLWGNVVPHADRLNNGRWESCRQRIIKWDGLWLRCRIRVAH